MLLSYIYLLAGVLSASPLPEHRLFEVQEAFAERQDDALLAIVADAERDWPHSDALWRLRLWGARSAIRKKDARQAARFLDAVKEYPAILRDELGLWRVEILRQGGRIDDAKAKLSSLNWTALSKDQRGRASYLKGDLAFALKDYAAAAKYYQSALGSYARAQPARRARIQLGDAQMALGDSAGALANWKKVAFYVPQDELVILAKKRLALATTHPSATRSLSQKLAYVDKLLRARSLDEAAGELDLLDKEGVDEEEVLFRRGIIAFRRGEFNLGLSLLERAKVGANDGRRNEIDKWRSRCFSSQGQTEDAVQIYSQLIIREPNRAEDYLYFSAWLTYAGGDYARSVSRFKGFIAKYPRSRKLDQAYWYLAWNQFRARDFDAALQSFSVIRKKFPRSSLLERVAYWEARVEEEDKKLDRALRAYKEVMNSSRTPYYRALAAQRLKILGAKASGEWAGSELPQLKEYSIDEYPGMGTSSSSVPWSAGSFVENVQELMLLGLNGLAVHYVQSFDFGRDGRQNALQRAAWMMRLNEPAGAFRAAGRYFGYNAKPQDVWVHYLYPQAYPALVSQHASSAQIPPALAWSIMRQESLFSPRARSWASAIGLMQLIPTTASKVAEAMELENFEMEWMSEPRTNIRLGTWYLGQLVEKFEGNVTLAIASYNAGPSAVTAWVKAKQGMAMDEFVEEIPYRETRHYVKKVLNNYSMYQHLYRENALTLPQEVPADVSGGVEF